MGDAEDKATVLERLSRVFIDGVPHNRALGLQFTDYDRANATATVRLPYAARLVGNPDTGVLHGGAITSLLDATCGIAVFLGMAPPRPIATLDLRIDYLRPADVDCDVVCEARCVKVTRHVAFARATAFGDDPARAVALAAATFMIFRRRKARD